MHTQILFLPLLFHLDDTHFKPECTILAEKKQQHPLQPPALGRGRAVDRCTGQVVVSLFRCGYDFSVDTASEYSVHGVVFRVGWAAQMAKKEYLQYIQ